MTTSELHALIHSLYAAPGTIDGWDAFLENLRIAVNGSAASLLTQDLESQQCSFRATTLGNVEAIRLYDTRWGADDPWAHSPKSGRLSRQCVVAGDELVPHRDIQRTAYYQEFARRYDIVRALIGVLEATPAALSVISISGSERRGRFCEPDVVLLEPLIPHIQRALQLHRRLAGAEGAAAGFENVIDRSSRAVMLADSQGRVTFMNRAASRLTALRDGLTIDHGELRAARAADTTYLRALLADAIKTSNGVGIGAGGTVVLGRPSGRRALVATVCPISRQRPFLASVDSAVAMVFVSDPEQRAVPDEETLEALFGLTHAEAKLTRLLAQGASLVDAQARLGLRRETVRSRVKTILQKTGTHRQAELVRLVLSGTPHI